MVVPVGKEQVLCRSLALEPIHTDTPLVSVATWTSALGDAWSVRGSESSSHSVFLMCLSPSLDGSASQAQQLPSSQVLWPDEAVCLRKKKRHSRPDPFARLSDLCHRQLPEDQTAILNSVDHDDPGHATLL